MEMKTKKKRIKTPVLLQMEAAECGAASLGIVLAYYGKYLPLERLRQLCNVNRNGSNAQSILLAGETAGMSGSGYAYAPEELLGVTAPVILHWGFNHFVVYEGYHPKTKEVYLNDPAVGHRTVSWEEFEQTYTGITLLLRPTERFSPGGKRVGVWKSLLSDLFATKRALAFILSVGFCLTIVNLFVPVLSQVFFDEVITYRHRPWLFDVLLGMAIALVLQSALTFLRSWCLLRWQGGMTIEKSSKFWAHILRLPLEFFQQRFTGDIALRIQYNESVAAFVSGNLATTVLDAIVACFYLTLLFLYNVDLTLLGLVFTAINISVTYFTFRYLSEQQMKLQQEAGRMYGLAVAGITAMDSLKANGNESDFFVKWANANARYLDMTQKNEYYSQYISFIPSALSGINASLIMALGGFQIMDGFMTIGIFVAFQNLMSNFQTPVGNLVNMSQKIQQTQAQMMKIDDVLRYGVAAEKDTDAKAPPRLSGQLEFRAVTFSYANIGKPFLKKLNFRIDPGRRLAIVGKSGSGKSTAARLAAGFYRPWSGEILFDGIPIEAIPREVLANSIALVEQEIFLFEGTVAENIALFDAGVSRQDIIQAARDAQIHDDILLLNGGYDAWVGEGGYNFSGGQRQRLEIARALATNPSLLIFDEATSALDPITEKAIVANIRRRGCACLMIAHRLSTIRDCDEIIVLQKGRVVQRGTHEELAAAEGAYKRLIQE